MSAGRPIRSILIKGAGLRAWLPAAFLSAHFPNGGCAIHVQLSDQNSDAQDILARPQIRRLHQKLEITEAELAKAAKARPAFVAKVETGNTSILLPFGAFGFDRDGAEFHHFFRRAQMAGHTVPLAAYNLATQLACSDVRSVDLASGLPGVDYGYSLSVTGYTELLKGTALERGVQEVSAPAQADLTIDATAIPGKDHLTTPTHWSGACLHLAAYTGVPGIELHTMLTAMELLIALLPDTAFHTCETREYDRLSHAEHQRIADMFTLLFDTGENRDPGSGLIRKQNVYEATGRIPVEDYEVFSKAEWLAAFSARNVFAREYDRLADRMDEASLLSWLGRTEQDIKKAVLNMTAGEKVA